MPTRKRAIVPILLIAGLTLFLAGCGGPNLFDYVRHFAHNGICWAIVVILDIIALVEVWGSRRGTSNKVLWGLFIIFFPILGCVAYYVFARE